MHHEPVEKLQTFASNTQFHYKTKQKRRLLKVLYIVYDTYKNINLYLNNKDSSRLFQQVCLVFVSVKRYDYFLHECCFCSILCQTSAH